MPGRNKMETKATYNLESIVKIIQIKDDPTCGSIYPYAAGGKNQNTLHRR